MNRYLNGREQKLFLACVLTVLSCVFFSYFVVPLREESERVLQETAALQKQLECEERIIEKAGALNRRYKAYQDQFSHSGANEEVAASVLSQIEEIGGKIGLRLMDLKSQMQPSNTYAYEFVVNLMVESSFLEMVRFLYLLQQPPYLFHVQEVEFEKLVRGESSGLLTMKCVLNKGFMRRNGERKTIDLPAEFMPFRPEPFEVYAREIGKRDFFRGFEHRAEPEAIVLGKALPVLEKQIKLIGIFLDEDSKAVIEDLQGQQVHFLSKGESFGDIFLEDIREDKVIFVYNKERIEMGF